MEDPNRTEEDTQARYTPGESVVKTGRPNSWRIALLIVMFVVLPVHWGFGQTGAIIIPELDPEERCRRLGECELPPAEEFPAQALVERAVQGELGAIKDLLKEGYDPRLSGRTTNKDGRPYCTSPLGAAAATGHLEIAELLIDLAGIDADYRAPADGICQDDDLTPLMRAVQNGHAEMVELLLARGADVNTRTRGRFNRGSTALNIAAYRTSLIEVLIRHGADVNAIGAGGATPLLAAIGAKDPAGVEILLRNGADPNIHSPRGVVPLHSAVSKHPQWVRTLIDYGADIQITTWEGDTLLHSISRRTPPDIIELLIAEGLDPEALNRHKATPLYKAAQIGYLDAAKLLVEHGARFDSATLQGSTPLLAATCKPEMMDFLLELGADIQRQNVHGNTVFHQAARGACSEIFDFLIERGARIEWRNHKGNTALLEAITAGLAPYSILFGDASKRVSSSRNSIQWYERPTQAEAVVALLALGADPNIRNRDGLSPLHYAVKLRSPWLVDTLVQAGARLTFADDNGNTPLHLAAEDGRTEMFMHLLSSGADLNARNCRGRSPLHQVTIPSRPTDAHRAIVAAVAARCGDLDPVDRDGATPLHLALERRRERQALDLIDLGCDPLLANDNGWTPLHWAASRGLERAVRRLLETGAEGCRSDFDGNRPIHRAAQSGETVVLVLLHETCPDVDVRNNEGQSPLHMAAIAKKPETVAALLNWGATPSLQDAEGNTALHNSVKRRDLAAAEDLLDHGADPDIANTQRVTPRAMARRLDRPEWTELFPAR